MAEQAPWKPAVGSDNPERGDNDVKLIVSFHTDYQRRMYRKVELTIPASATVRFQQEHGCLTVSEASGNLIAAFNSVSWFARESLKAETSWVDLPPAPPTTPPARQL